MKGALTPIKKDYHLHLKWKPLEYFYRPVVPFIIFILIGVQEIQAQVRHNFPVGPQNTTCDSLDLSGDTIDSLLLKIENTSWRYRQSIHLNRPYGFRRADYYSCDGNTGYLVIETDNDKKIFGQVPVNLWEEFSGSSDPDTFIEEKIQDKFMKIK